MTDFDAGPHCGRCRTTVIRAETPNAKGNLVDAEPVPGGNIRLTARPDRIPLAQLVAPQLAFGRTDLHVLHACPAAPGRRRARQHA